MKKIIALLMVVFSFLGVNAQSTPSFPGGDSALQTYIADTLQ